MVWMTSLFPYHQTGKRCWLGLARRGFCVCPCVCVCPCLSLSLWDLPVWKRLRTVGLSSIFCIECLTSLLQLRGSISINQPWGLLRTNLGLSLPAEASKQILTTKAQPWCRKALEHVLWIHPSPGGPMIKCFPFWRLSLMYASWNRWHVQREALPLPPGCPSHPELRAAAAAAWWSRGFLLLLPCCCTARTTCRITAFPLAKACLRLCFSCFVVGLVWVWVLFCLVFFGTYSVLLFIPMLLTTPCCSALSNQSLL